MADKNKGNYDASSITVLEGLEPVRKRPGMYIGTTGPDGLHHLITEIFDNSRDEAMGGFANDIEIALLPGDRVRVADNGRGIPVDVHKQTKISALEMVMTTLHAGGKFGGEDSGYKVSGGLHGVGASVVNALSTHTKVLVHRDGGIHMQEYNQGKRKAAVKFLRKVWYRISSELLLICANKRILFVVYVFLLSMLVSKLRRLAKMMISFIYARQEWMRPHILSSSKEVLFLW